MPATYDSIATSTVSSNTTTITFSSIPQTYTDLVLICNFKNTTSVDMFIKFNNISTSIYSDTHLYGITGNVVGNYRQTSASLGLLDLGANGMGTALGTTIINLMNYSNTDKFKTYLSRTAFTSIHTGATSGLWRSTAAINQIDIIASSSNTIATGGVFSLYGIKAF